MNIFPCVKAIIKKDNSFLIVKRAAKETNSPNRWSFVGGGVELGESYIQALQREVMEEASIKVTPVRYISSKTIPAKEGGVVLISYVFCEYESGTVKLNEEHDEYLWITEIPDFLPKEHAQLLKTLQ